MKRNALIITLILTAMASFVGCKKKEEALPVVDTSEIEEIAKTLEIEKPAEVKEEEKAPMFKTGAYSRQFEEEFADGVETFTYYILFNEDGTGFEIAQDDVKFNWEEGKITYEDGNSTTFELKSDDVIEVKNGEYTEEYTYCGDKLPEGVADHMRFNLDGTLKINNMDAGFSFFDLVSSDTISFYSSSSSVQYSVEKDDLQDMSGLYMELRDDYLGILLVKTPSAPKIVGAEHVLQYVDGKIFDIAGTDKIDAIYKNAAVIVTTDSEDDGDYTYFYKPDSNDELFAFALKYTEDGTEYLYELYDEYGNYEEATIEEFNAAFEEATAGDAPLDEINWKPLDRAVSGL